MKKSFFALALVVLASCGGQGGMPENDREQAQAGPAQILGEDIPGRYTGTLPCLDCAGTSTSLELLTDGSYKISERFDGKSEGAELDSDGKWTFVATENRIILDPTAQDWEDRHFEVLGGGRLRPLDSNGAAYSIEGTNDMLRVK